MASIRRPTQHHEMFAWFLLSADQVANLTAGNHVEWDTAAGDLDVSTGAGQADGQVTLPGGHNYRLTTTIRIASATSGSLNFGFYDVTTAAFITSQVGAPQTTNRASGFSHAGVLTVDFYVAVDTVVEVRVTANTAINRFQAVTSFWNIQEIPRG